MDIPVGPILDIARKAGAAIMEVYKGEIVVEIKDDQSPLTLADQASHEIIFSELQKLYPDIPVLSEEGKDTPFEIRRRWSRFWLVDPLDGTKEFIKGNGEFTVNIALIEAGRPVLGVVYVPAVNKMYYGKQNEGTWLVVGNDVPKPIQTSQADELAGFTVVMSRSHPSPELDKFLQTIKVARAISVGSSLKFCAVAAGDADIYPRLGPTMEWDTAAGQAIVECAGGTVLTTDGKLMTYNKENLLNSHFIVRGGWR